MTTTAPTKPRITYYDANMRVLQDLTTAEEIWNRDERCCDECGKPADMIGTGHRDHELDCPITRLEPPPWFKCAACHLRWHQLMVDIIASGLWLKCFHCLRVFDNIDDFSLWRPV